MTNETTNLFARHVAEQADHELVMVRKADADEMIAELALAKQWHNFFFVKFGTLINAGERKRLAAHTKEIERILMAANRVAKDVNG